MTKSSIRKPLRDLALRAEAALWKYSRELEAGLARERAEAARPKVKLAIEE